MMEKKTFNNLVLAYGIKAEALKRSVDTELEVIAEYIGIDVQEIPERFETLLNLTQNLPYKATTYQDGVETYKTHLLDGLDMIGQIVKELDRLSLLGLYDTALQSLSYSLIRMMGVSDRVITEVLDDEYQEW